MPIVIKSLTGAPNRSVEFNFDSDVVAFVVGISYWKFRFGGADDHHVKSIELSVSSSKPRLRQVTSTVTARLLDDSGHSIDTASSSVTLVCLAATVSTDTNITMATIDNITPPGLTRDGLLPSSAALDTCVAFLEGFRVSYAGSSDHHVKEVQFGVGLVPAGTMGQLSSFAQIRDGSGSVGTGSVDAGVVATTSQYWGLVGQAVLDRQTSGASTVAFGRPIVDGAVLLQSYQVAFSGDDHHIKEIGGGTSKWSIQGGNLVLANACAFMSDSSGHRQSDSASRVSMIAFGVYN